MNANEVDQNCSSKPSICADTNANNKLPINKGAIPKQTIRKTTSNVHPKLNNNTHSCLKMGLGNGNDPNIDVLNKVAIQTLNHPLIKAQDVENAVDSISNYRPCCSFKNDEFVREAGPSGCDIVPARSKSSTEGSSGSDLDSESDTSLSISDDGCVYTYKGDNNVEEFPLLPHIEPPVIQVPLPPPRDSSPEMDYLEMDFDPGPSCEADSESSCEIELPTYPPREIDLAIPSTSSGIRNQFVNNNPDESSDEDTPEPLCPQNDQLLYEKDCLEQSLAYSIFYDDSRPLTPLMFWDEKDAQAKQFNLLYAGCVTNAVLNSLLELNKIPSRIIPEWANQYLTAQSPKDDLELISYLLSKSQSIPSHDDLVTGLIEVSNGTVYTRFFPTWPERNFSLSHWLKYWLEHNVIPIVTFNQQIINKDPNSPTTPIPEWQHHTVFGVTHNGIYLTDPIHCINEEILRKKLTSDSILLIKRGDVVSRWNKTTDLGPLYAKSEIQWRQVNTLGKLVHMLREMKSSVKEKSGFTTSSNLLPIPITVKAGITLVSCKDNPACDLIQHCPELPLKKPS